MGHDSLPYPFFLQNLNHRPFVASHSRGTKPLFWSARDELGEDKQGKRSKPFVFLVPLHPLLSCMVVFYHLQRAYVDSLFSLVTLFIFVLTLSRLFGFANETLKLTHVFCFTDSRNKWVVYTLLKQYLKQCQVGWSVTAQSYPYHFQEWWCSVFCTANVGKSARGAVC